MARMVEWFKRHFWLFVIIGLGLLLRLANLREWLHFEFDEEVIAWKLRQFVQFGKPFLIGGGTPFGFHLGPAFYYLSAVPLFFSRLDPVGWGVAAAVFGTGTIWLMWLAGKTLYNGRVGLIAALLWATSFTAVMADRHWWPLVLDPMLSLIVLISMFRILQDAILPSANGRIASFHWWVILGLALAFAWQADLTVLPLFLAAGVVAVLNFRRQWKGILTVGGILLISFLPLVFFELRHPGANLGEFTQGANPPVGVPDLNTLLFIPQSLSRLLFPVTNLDGNLLKFYSWCKDIAEARVSNQPWWAVGLT
ncbi:MAG: glycosyltransferase family 39 protein, partial [Patescibacteria group bacterium]|nr:glycosyltransferase family 39 protein [Patescibacteria group bacterium]